MRQNSGVAGRFASVEVSPYKCIFNHYTTATIGENKPFSIFSISTMHSILQDALKARALGRRSRTRYKIGQLGFFLRNRIWVSYVLKSEHSNLREPWLPSAYVKVASETAQPASQLPWR